MTSNAALGAALGGGIASVPGELVRSGGLPSVGGMLTNAAMSGIAEMGGQFVGKAFSNLQEATTPLVDETSAAAARLDQVHGILDPIAQN